MKSIFNETISPLIIVCAIFLISCEHDDTVRIDEQTKSQNKSFIIQMESGDHLRATHPSVYQKLTQSSNTAKSNDTSTAYSLDLNTIQIIERNTYTQYTTTVHGHSEQNNYLINYMFLEFDDGAEYQFLIKYPRIGYDQGGGLDHANAIMETINGDTLLQKSGIGQPRPCLDGTPELIGMEQQYQCTQYNCTGGNHAIGEDCDCGTPGYTCVPAYQICGWVTVNQWSCTGGSAPSGGDGNDGTAGGGSSDPNNPLQDDPIETVPILTDWEKIENCMNSSFLTDNIQLTPEMLIWLQDNNHQVAGAMNDLLSENSCSTEAQEDILAEINMLMEYELTEVNFDNFAVDEIDNDCLLRVVRDEIIRNLNAGIINQIRNTIGQQPSYILGFRDNDILNGVANAGTSMPSASAINNGYYPIIVNFAEDYLSGNPTKLSLAANTIHEMVHAHLIYLYLEGELLQKYPSFTDLKIKFDIYTASRNETTLSALEDSMHIAMVDLIGTMAYALFKYAKNNRMESVTHEYCKDVTKGTFSGTPAMNEITPDVNLQNDYILKAQNEQNNTSDAKGKDC
ncbi:hypothetical protein KORDIASMS9_02812 [Kordia sp. SMS9]|uniref:hypothetical protein n=1 Tax=Kordia sp. SMS9 TaxID=2282170 RepID=UPI000E0D711A|nr:hypothetical protein [Kordia sp. SMS9]AXG70572.1 hypothetical protein KORDIASMS9_02812 [Kordia sp. SMS9]